MVLYATKTRTFNYEVEKLRSFLRIKPQYGANEQGIPRESNKVPRYIRITDIDEYGRLSRELGKTAETIEEKYFLNDNDLLFARSGNTVGKVYLHKAASVDYDCFFAGYMIRFVLKQETINPDYVFCFTQTRAYEEWVRAVRRTSGQPNINAEEYKSLLIPVPPEVVQNQLVKLFHAGFQAMIRKEAEAQALLDSIDDYLLKELGIKMPHAKQNTLATRIIRTSFKTVSGNRFDPSPYHSTRIESIENLKSGVYKTLPLRDLVAFSRDVVSGSAAGLPYIGLENIESNTGRYLPAEIEEKDFSTASHFTAGSILFPRLRPYLNKIFYAPFEGVCSTEFYVLSPLGIDAKYLSHFLRSSLVVNQTSYLMTGNTLPRLQTVEVKELLVPVPPPAIQSRIVDKVETIRLEADMLRFSAMQELEQAKQEIERIILGEQA